MANKILLNLQILYKYDQPEVNYSNVFRSLNTRLTVSAPLSTGWWTVTSTCDEPISRVTADGPQRGWRTKSWRTRSLAQPLVILGAMRRARRIAILLYGLLETFIFTGNIFGWTALHYMLRQEGIYEHLCGVESTPLANASDYISINSITDLNLAPSRSNLEHDFYSLYLSNTSDSVPFQSSYASKNVNAVKTGCDAQDRLLNLAFTIGSFCIGSTAFVWGFLLEKWGFRCVRICINGLVSTGTVLLSLTKKDTSYLIFPALALMCLAGVPLRMVNIEIAGLFPKQRATIITLYSGAFTASASVFVFMKYAFDAGLQWEWVCFILVALSIFMLPATFFLLPAEIQEPGTEQEKRLFFLSVAEVAGITSSVWGRFTLTPGSPNFRRNTNIVNILPTVRKVKAQEMSSPSEEVSPTCDVPLKESLFSSSFMQHSYWFSWLLLYTIIYVGTLHLWTSRISNDPRDVALFSEVYGLFQVTGIFLAPLGGVFMDWSIRNASQEVDPEIRRLQVMRSAFWPMLITTGTEAVVQVCKYFNDKMAIYISIVFVTLLRAFLIATGTAYIRIRFQADHFNKLLGILSTLSAVVSLLQFPLFIWESGSSSNVIYVNIFYTACLLVALVHPLLLLVTPLQKHFISKEKMILEKYTT